MNEVKGRAKGGIARAKVLSPERRKEIAMEGVAAKRALSLLPQATHSGELKIGDAILSCYVLDDGSRVLSLRGINFAFSGSIGGLSKPSKEGVRNLPRILSSKSIKPLISDEFMARLLEPKEFKPSHGGRSAFGYDAALLPDVCEVIIDAYKIGAIRNEKAEKVANALLRGFARVGVVALVDEATGYQKDRAKDELCKILEAFVAKELQPWIKTFPADFYENMFRLRDLEYPGNGVKRPQYFGHLTNDIIYRRLAPMVLKELKEQAAKDEKGRIKHRLHQKLTPEIGHPKLKELVISVTTVMKLSDHWEDFKSKLDRVHPAFNETMQLPFELEQDSGKGF